MRDKLAKKSGSAMVLALLCFLLCACVGTMVVTAASANAGKAARAREEEQRYQAVKAAANAMAQFMTDSPYTAEFTEYYERRMEVNLDTNGLPVTMDVRSASAIKPSIENPATNFFPPDSKVAGILGNSIRNIYLNNTRLSTGHGVLSRMSETKGGLVSQCTDRALTDIGPGRYDLKFEVDSFPDILVTLEIKSSGLSGFIPNLYEATITARDAAGSHVIVLSSPAKKVDTEILVSASGTGDIGRPYKREMKYRSVISWEDWKAR